MERSATADIAKTIGIILVVIGHYNPADAPEWYHLANRFIYAFHMPLFMFASGYIYAMTGNSQTRGGKLHFEEIQKVDDPLFLDKRRHNQHQTFDATGNVRGKSRDGSIVYQDVLSARSRLFPLVYLGAMADIPAHKHDKDENGKNRAVRSKSPDRVSACRLARNLLHKQGRGHAEIFYAGRVSHKLAPLARFGEENTGNDSGLRPARPVRMHLARPKRHTHRPDGLYIAICRHPYDMRDIGTDQKPETYNAKLLVVSASSYIIYLFHTTFEGFVKSLVQQVPLLANGNDPLYFSVGAAAVIGAGIFLPIILHRYILQRNRLLRFLFGLKPAK